ncbi:MAG: hypothetical protein Kow0032_03770 [Methyloligellaceae bacterium]
MKSPANALRHLPAGPGALASAAGAFLLLAAGSAGVAQATDPKAICDEREKIVALLDGKPHFERQVFVLQDEYPGQGHRLELFANDGEGGRYSYSLLRIRKGGNIACILTAGLVSGRQRDAHGNLHVTLNDEIDPDTFQVVVCGAGYVITKGIVKANVCESPQRLEYPDGFVASFGRILQDHREDVSWPKR